VEENETGSDTLPSDSELKLGGMKERARKRKEGGGGRTRDKKGSVDFKIDGVEALERCRCSASGFPNTSRPLTCNPGLFSTAGPGGGGGTLSWSGLGDETATTRRKRVCSGEGVCHDVVVAVPSAMARLCWAKRVGSIGVVRLNPSGVGMGTGEGAGGRTRCDGQCVRRARLGTRRCLVFRRRQG
jgi:hypothetical protein